MPPQSIHTNALFYNDDRPFLREYVAAKSLCLAPLFASYRLTNGLFNRAPRCVIPDPLGSQKPKGSVRVHHRDSLIRHVAGGASFAWRVV
jgi:hypothetical protein